jgi:hypothetical protein
MLKHRRNRMEKAKGAQMPLGGEKTKDFEKRVKDKKECSWE